MASADISDKERIINKSSSGTLKKPEICHKMIRGYPSIKYKSHYITNTVWVTNKNKSIVDSDFINQKSKRNFFDAEICKLGDWQRKMCPRGRLSDLFTLQLVQKSAVSVILMRGNVTILVEENI